MYLLMTMFLMYPKTVRSVFKSGLDLQTCALTKQLMPMHVTALLQLMKTSVKIVPDSYKYLDCNRNLEKKK